MSAYSHLNVYDGRDAQRGGTTTKWVIQAFEGLLPEPVISPTCQRKGHDWTPAMTPLFRRAEVRACKRCMRRGLLVFETREVSNQDDVPASRRDS